MDFNLVPRSRAQAYTAPMMRLSWTHRWEPPGLAASPRATTFAAHEIREELDAIARLIRSDAVEAGVGRLRALLRERRCGMWPGGWQILARSVVREHSILDLIHESPLSRAVFERPLGATTGADILDLLDRAAALPPGTTDRGRRIAACELNGDTPRAVRARRDLIARAMVDLVTNRPNARVLGLGAGRLRERDLSKVLVGGRLATFFAFEEDAGTLPRITRAYPWGTTIHDSVRKILSGALRWLDLDLIYSAGLYERLSDRSATTLTTKLFEMLAPGGRLLLANIAPEATDRAYLEACMDWWMTCRGESSMHRLVAAVPRDDLASSRTFRDRTGHVVCLELIRA
jgi:extracellular factor (EF) 3-hydroxypalmitic acid methyl ester biosynthesis protein